MYRTSLTIFLSLWLAVGLVAKESQPELEGITVKIMVNAYLATDYDTVETLFHKLSTENKEKFLKEAVDLLDQLFDARVCLSNLPEVELKQFGESGSLQIKRTQLLGRLTLSLFEESVKEPQRAASVAERNLRVAQPVAPFSPPGHDDGYITLGSYGRVYIKGLDAGEIMDAVKFHLSKFIPNGKKAAGKKYFVAYYVGDIVPITSLSDELNESKNTSGYDGTFGALPNIIMQVVEPDSWNTENGGEIAIHFATKSLAIRQTAEVHKQIEDLLHQIRQINAAHESQMQVR